MYPACLRRVCSPGDDEIRRVPVLQDSSAVPLAAFAATPSETEWPRRASPRRCLSTCPNSPNPPPAVISSSARAHHINPIIGAKQASHDGTVACRTARRHRRNPLLSRRPCRLPAQRAPPRSPLRRQRRRHSRPPAHPARLARLQPGVVAQGRLDRLHLGARQLRGHPRQRGSSGVVARRRATAVHQLANGFLGRGDLHRRAAA